MKRHLTLSTTSQYAHTQGDNTEVADRARGTRAGRAGDGEISLSGAAHTQPHPALTSPPIWKHKLVLTGKLNRRSAPELEEEIECLCQEGVTTLTLDLRQLDAIDPTGATAIACSGAVCKMRGHDFAVIPGSRFIHRALAEAGATDLLAPDPSESVVLRFSSRSPDGCFSDRSTTMIKSL